MYNFIGNVPDGKCFLVAYDMSKYVIALKMTDRNQTCRNERVFTHSDIQQGST